MTEPVRKPAVFRADDPRLVVTAPEEPMPAPVVRADGVDPDLVAVPVRRRRMRWGALLWSALSGLVVLGIGLAVTNLVEELFARSPWLGGAGFVLAILAALALLAILVRELVGLARLATVETMQRRAAEIIESDDRDAGRSLLADMLALTRRMPRLARARARLEGHRSDIIDGRDLLRLAERELLGPLDAEARRLVAGASKRVSVVTAISPRAAVDLIFVLVNALRLVRQLAVLYGGRPGTMGVLALFRRVLSHLAVTGGVALTDSVVQQVIGHGIAARLSARLGEGMVNGLLTARLGLLAIEQTRPLPFYELQRPALNDLAGPLLRTTEAAAERP